jgi:hypothetical protein
MPGTRSKGKLWQRERIFSLRNWKFFSMRPQCCDAAAQSFWGAVGRLTIRWLIELNSWSPAITTIWKPCRRYILYVAWRASHINAFVLKPRCVTVVKHIFVRRWWNICACWQRSNWLPTQHLAGAWWAPWEPWWCFAPHPCHFFSLCSLSFLAPIGPK